MGMTVEQIQDMTWWEFNYRSKALNLMLERQWLHTRFLGSIMINTAAFRKGKRVKPEDLVPLEMDKRVRRRKPLITADEYLDMVEKFS